ncbi:myosin heavy chain, cardiac muscle isoform-like [Anopheles stephensi]|uniref:myosin heavy chain, cardiac muscle isoform-like n=1 Tax=Anopheles stephensi TaxID=30069 RepID=UPI001658AA47|nr:myosin heavy chain, cardiac muscle isoform-like [Anopheles stephensi]
MASKQIVERAKSALLYTKDLLLEEDDEVEDEDYTAEDGDESEGENCNGSDADAAAASNGGKDGQQENDGAKALATKSDKDPAKGKKSSKGVGKTLKSVLSAAADPFGIRKTDFKIGVNVGFEAARQKDRGDRGTNDERRCDAPSLVDPKKLKILEKENVSLERLANKYLEGCIRLRQKVLELSKVEEQLSTLQADKDAVKAELLQLQTLHRDFKSNAETQGMEHRNEVKRLNLELKNASEDMEKMKSTNKEHVHETGRLKKELETISKQKEDMANQFQQTESSLSSEMNKLELCLQQTRKEKTELQERILQIQAASQTAEAQLSESTTQNVELQQKLREAESENGRLNTLLAASNAKILELKRAIQILETNPSTTTAVQAQGGGSRSYSCPICGAEFSSLANMQLHAEDCC